MKPALLRPQARQDQADEILYDRDKPVADHLDVLRLLGERQDIAALWSEPEPGQLHEPEPSYGS